MKIPDIGLTDLEISNRMADYRVSDGDWRSGRTWSLVFYAGHDVYEVAKRAYTEFFSENALNPATFPSLRRFEAEVVAMGADLLGDADAVGNMTSGGTESLLLALKTARDWAREERGVDEPEVVLPVTAHPALLKGAHYFGIRPIVTPVKDDFTADVDAIADSIGPKTVLVVGSAPQYPQGVIDPIEEIAAVAQSHGIPMHVDACLGGYFLPWLVELGYDLPRFDLSVEGVWSLSADLHKYGYAAKGASTIFYKDPAYRRYQFFAYADWPGGLYGSPTIAGTRPGGAVAAAWAVMHYLGREGYLRLARTVMDTTERLADCVRSIDELEILGSPAMCVFAFASVDPDFDVVSLGAEMHNRGWRLDRQQLPDSMHMMVTPAHASVVERFSEDLSESASRVRATSAAKEARRTDKRGGAAHYGGIDGSATQRRQGDSRRYEEAILGFLDSLNRL
jgi:sphinganine-1-phosphate aldolase